MQNAKESKWIYVLLSIFVAITFWLYVRSDEDPEMNTQVKNIAVNITGQQVLENQGLIITSVSHKKVDLTWKGAWSIISQLDNSNVTVTVDASRITEPGTYDLSYDVNLPANVAKSALTLQGGSPARVTVNVSRLGTETFEIHPVLEGGIADGYQAGEFTVEPEQVTISGREELLAKIDQVQVILARKDMKESFNGELALTLLDANGKKIDTTDLQLSIDKAAVSLPIVVVKEIPITIDFIAGGGATEDNITYKMSHSTITVSGPDDVLKYMDEVSLGSIDLSQVMGKAKNDYPIYLPEKVENVSGLNSVSVEVTVEGLATRAFDVDNIQLINAPKGYNATLSTLTRTVILRGPQEELDTVFATQLSIVADLSELSAAKGSYSVDAKVNFYGSSDVGVIGEYNVVVYISRA